ncbi:hypothetical protein FACS1894137_06880 [Spirochaetia bacterium]|nr:hypothetical protein FACS1894137_06880 [Spirochaetia bacterium]
MFGTYFKSSVWALPVLVLVPVAICALYIYVINPQFAQLYTVSDNDTYGTWVMDDGGVDKEYVIRSMVIAGALNFILLMILPCAIGGTNSGIKKGLFYLGFFLNLAASLIFPMIYINRFLLDPTTTVILIALHVAGFLFAFVFGALFVAPAYVPSFWFYYRRVYRRK